MEYIELVAKQEKLRCGYQRCCMAIINDPAKFKREYRANHNLEHSLRRYIEDLEVVGNDVKSAVRVAAAEEVKRRNQYGTTADLGDASQEQELPVS